MSGPDSKDSIPLVVDLDGTLIKTDLLLESLYGTIRKDPGQLIRIPFWFLRGRVYLKSQLARTTRLDPGFLPYHQDFLEYLREQAKAGRRLVLATASHEMYAKQIADYLGIFAEVLASNETMNLKGKKKAVALCEKYGEKGFDYCGDAAVDLHVFRRARRAVLVNAAKPVVRAARRVSEVEKVFDDRAKSGRQFLRALRIYQWVKNILLFIPLVTSHKWTHADALLETLFGFFSFSLCASGGYLFNDLLDLSSDRRHPRKKNRPLASGSISVWTGSFWMIALQAAGLTLAFLLNGKFFLLLVFYCAVNLAYTFHLKTYVLIDVLVLAGLYTLRIMAGSVLADAPLSFWLFAFSIFIFFSLALVKRCSELNSLSKTAVDRTSGRDYTVPDFQPLREMGIASGYMAILIVALYINSPDVVVLYSHPKVLWMVCPAFFYWISRIWLKTARGEMLDDPIVFSAKDKGSRVVALAVLLIIILAS